ncbi:deoxynucleoside kinase [Sporosarcina sp. HYO08]|uniref:deoxynucleoside kinase n=1 Tax=Sporosarcina sp. HYO08 TaxID=1759557 RepID=UPI0007949650|nr:deoxynucleoside kinase [Sporosarcina sp. HYO08]KXH86701.1 deoxyguanosine kinase [Sporosarcina sp. HYO08]
MSVPFIAVEGPIGVGKTSLSKEIADTLQFHLLREIVDENPFLHKFYENIEEWSFQTEMFFLCNRYKQLSDLQKEWVAEGNSIVADYHIFKNLIFSKRTLEPTEYEKYEKIFHILTENMPVPNLIIYLHASLPTLMNRIAMRGREFEKNMDPGYLQQLSDDYEEFIAHFEKEHPEIPILRVNGDELDFVHDEKDLQIILNQITVILEKGCQIR